MNFPDELVIAQLPLCDPDQILTPTDIEFRVARMCAVVNKVTQSALWRKYTQLCSGVKSSATGLVCVLAVEPAAQAHLEVQSLVRSTHKVAEQVMQEKRLWVDALQHCETSLIGLRVNQAAAATAVFRDEHSSGIGSIHESDLMLSAIFKSLLPAFSSIKGTLETQPWQLDLDGFDGYVWADETPVRGLLKRTSYGVSLDLLPPFSVNLKAGHVLQIHYAGISDDLQEHMDAAVRSRSAVNLMGRVGVRHIHRSPAVFQPVSVLASQ